MAADENHIAEVTETIRKAANDGHLARQRFELAMYAAEVFATSGELLHVAGHIVGSDRKEGASPFGHGNDEAVGVSVLLRIGGQLISASADLLTHGKPYAGAALLRQLVEVEYLAWAFETRNGDAERWLRSDRKIRETFFRPAKLRGAAGGKFRGKDYGYHCEFGGHPVPRGTILLQSDDVVPQLFLADLLGHTGRIWDHLIQWSVTHAGFGDALLKPAPEMSKRFGAWKQRDPLSALPAPP